MVDGESSASEPPASQALNMAPAAFAVRDVRAHPGVQSSQTPASAPVKPFVHRHVSDSMVDDARLQVREDREKVALFRTERSKQLEQVRLLDHRVDLWECSVQDGAAAVVKLVQRQKWQQHQAERAAIAREANRPMSPARAITSTARDPSGSRPAASQAGPSRRLPSPTPGHPMATSSPVGSRFVGTIPKLRQGQNPNHAAQADRSRNRAKCGFTGGRARSQSRHSNSSRSSTPHQPYTGQHHGSAGPRDRLGNRVSHPPQQHHSRRL